MQYLTKEQILNADDIAYADVDVPEWGGVVRVRTLMGHERDEFEGAVVDERGEKISVAKRMENMRARLVALTVVDAEGQRVFSEQEAAALGKKSAAALERVFTVAARLARLLQSDIDELVKN